MPKIYEIFKILSDKTRLEIVEFLSSKKEGSCSDLSKRFKDLSQPTISHHFNILVKSGIINVRKEGTSHFYSLNRGSLKKMGIDVSKLQF